MYSEISSCEKINSTYPKKVNCLIESFLKKGWVGAPILYSKSLNYLVTGSHRLEALNKLEDNYYEYDEETQCKIDDLFDSVEAIDVDDIINKYCTENDCCFDEIDFSSLRQIFQGTYIEKYSDGIAEW